MKKIITAYIITLLGMMIIASCGSDNGDDKGGGKGSESNYVPQTYTQSVSIDANGGTNSVKLNDLSTSIKSIVKGGESSTSWIAISNEAYTSGAPSVLLEVEENNTDSKRTCEVTIIATNGDKVQLTVTQEAGVPKGIDDIHNNSTDQPAY